MKKKLILIDGNSIANRAFYGVPDLTNHDGLHTNAIYGFLNMLFKFIDEETPTHILVAFDEKAPTFRHKMYDGYKGKRKPMPAELTQQMPVLRDVLKSMNIRIYSKEGIEADDILGTMSSRGKKAGYEVTVISGDRDLLQLVEDGIRVKIPKTKGGKTITEDYDTGAVISAYKVTPAQIIDLKGLMGDASDNIPGVPGVGEKTAIKLLDKFGTVEKVITHMDEITDKRAQNAIKEHKDLAKLSKELATIKRELDFDVTLESCEISDMFNENAYHMIESLDIKSILIRFNMGDVLDASLTDDMIISSDISDFERYTQKLKDTDIAIKCVLRDKSFIISDKSGQLSFSPEGELSEDKLKGIAIAYEDAKGVNAAYFQISQSIKEQDVVAKLTEYINSGHTLIANDIKSISDIFSELDENNSFDTNIAAYVLNPVSGSYTEEDIATEYTSVSIPPFEGEFGKASPDRAADEKKDELAKYMGLCAIVDIKAYPKLKKQIQKLGLKKVYYDMELPLIFVLSDVQKQGMYVKKEALFEYSKALKTKIGDLENGIYERAGEEFNILSPKQLGNILFEKMHMPYGKKTKTGYSTSAEVLEKLKYEDPIVEMVLEYRQLTKLKSTYADGLSAYIDDDGRIRTTFHQNIAATGRLSSTDPNLQNIPIRMELGRQIRKVFVPADGYTFVDADYSQIELRVLAHMSGDEKLIKAYKENADIHRMTASQVFHTPFDEVSDIQRRNAKAVNFGIIYGISGFGLSRDLGISQKEAKKYIEDYFSTYPKVHDYIEGLVDTAKKKGYVTSLYGRKRPIPELKSKNFMQRQFGERIAMNSPIQGTAADIMKIAMIRVWKRLKKEKLKSRLILQIHDELLIETKLSETDEVKKILTEEMMGACELSVPLIVDVKQGDTWYDAK